MIELIWDGHHNGTIVTPSGVTLDVNPESAPSPLDLLAAAAASCMMRAFLGLADEAKIGLLGFVSAASVDLSDTSPRVRVKVLLTVPGQPRASDRRLNRLLQHARRQSPVCRILGRRLVCETEIRPLETG
jgi:organic hydroperoxide reductase OsmC/OhrA